MLTSNAKTIVVEGRLASAAGVFFWLGRRIVA
jgi:hypothetical protein